MRAPFLKLSSGLIAASAVGLLFMGCNGKTGPAGQSGTNGTNGNDGKSPVVTVNAAQLTKAEWAQTTLQGSKISCTVQNGTPVVTFTVTTGSGMPVSGLSASNMDFSIAKLVPAATGSTAPSRWVNYLVVSTPAAGTVATPGWPEPEHSGTLVDNADGSYTYTFALDISKAKSYVDATTDDATHQKADLDDLTYDANAVHRVIATVGGNFSASDKTQVLTSANLSYDFIPATGKAAAATDPSRVIANLDSCNTCHAKLSVHANFFPAIQDTKLCVVCHTDQLKYGQGESQPASGTTLVAAGSYGSTQRLMGRALADFPNMIHHIHRGEELYYQGYNQFMAYNEVKYPQMDNCTKCHASTATTPQGDNWKMVPSMKACGGCHDNVDFANGVILGTTETHPQQTSDINCAGCHKAKGDLTDPLDVVTAHTYNDLTTLNTVTPTNISNFTYELKSATLNTSNQPVFVFRIKQDGTAITSFSTGDANNPITVNNAATGQVILNPNFKPIPGFIGGPSFYIQYGVTQDGIAAADFNANRPSVSLGALLIPSGYPKAGTLTGPDSDGYWTATLTGPPAGPATAYTGWVAPTGVSFSQAKAAPIAVPSGALMVTGMINGSFTQVNLTTYPYTAADPTAVIVSSTSTVRALDAAKTSIVSSTKTSYGYKASIGGLLRPAPVQSILFSGITGNKARRAIIDPTKCNACHERLGTKPNFHGGVGYTMDDAVAANVAAPASAATVGSGSRDNGTICAFCHTVNQTSSGWAANASTFVHAIHGNDKRTVPFNWHASSATDNYGTSMTYPGRLQDCEQCHVPGSYDFSASDNATAVPNLLWTTVGTGAYDIDHTFNPTGWYAISPYVKAATYSITAPGTASAAISVTSPYGSGFSITSAGVATQAQSNTLVSSPITAACASCHDTSSAISHMKLNGGAFYAMRSAVSDTSGNLINTESCLICHGAGKAADIKAVHMNFK